jgi:hypothetical protein
MVGDAPSLTGFADTPVSPFCGIEIRKRLQTRGFGLAKRLLVVKSKGNSLGTKGEPMRKTMVLLAAALLAGGALAPDTVEAQGRGKRRADDGWLDRDDRDGGKGPKFCRNGNGHPVHGRQWCVQKGFGLGNDRWDRVRWEDAVFGRPQPRRDTDLRRDVLRDVLGTVIYGRLDAQRRNFGAREPLSARWFDSEGRSVMLVNSGSIPIAELVDANRDRRIDFVLLNRR